MRTTPPAAQAAHPRQAAALHPWKRWPRCCRRAAPQPPREAGQAPDPARPRHRRSRGAPPVRMLASARAEPAGRLTAPCPRSAPPCPPPLAHRRPGAARHTFCDNMPMTASQPPIAAIATAPGRGGIGVVRVSGPDVAPIARALCGQTPAAPRHLPALPRRHRRRHRPRHRAVLPRAELLHRRRRARTAGPRRPGGDADAAGALPGSRPRHRPARRARRVHAPRLPQRQARPPRPKPWPT